MPFSINDLYNQFIPQTNATKSFLVHLIQAKSHAASKKGKLRCLSTMTESNIKMDPFWGQNITQIMHLFRGLLKKKKNPLANDLRSGMTVLSFLLFHPSFYFYFIYLFIFTTIGWLVTFEFFRFFFFYNAFDWAISFNITVCQILYHLEGRWDKHHTKLFVHYMKCNEIVHLSQSKGQYDWIVESWYFTKVPFSIKI